MANHPNRAADDNPLARALKAYRERRGLSQTQLADEHGIPVTAVHEWEAARGGRSTMARFLAVVLDEAG